MGRVRAYRVSMYITDETIIPQNLIDRRIFSLWLIGGIYDSGTDEFHGELHPTRVDREPFPTNNLVQRWTLVINKDVKKVI